MKMMSSYCLFVDNEQQNSASHCFFDLTASQTMLYQSSLQSFVAYFSELMMSERHPFVEL